MRQEATGAARRAIRRIYVTFLFFASAPFEYSWSDWNGIELTCGNRVGLLNASPRSINPPCATPSVAYRTRLSMMVNPWSLFVNVGSDPWRIEFRLSFSPSQFNSIPNAKAKAKAASQKSQTKKGQKRLQDDYKTQPYERELD